MPLWKEFNPSGVYNGRSKSTRSRVFRLRWHFDSRCCLRRADRGEILQESPAVLRLLRGQFGKLVALASPALRRLVSEDVLVKFTALRLWSFPEAAQAAEL